MVDKFVVAWWTEVYNQTTEAWETTQHIGLMGMDGELQIDELPSMSDVYVSPVGIYNFAIDYIPPIDKYVVVGSGDRLLFMSGYDKPSQGYRETSAQVTIYDATDGAYEVVISDLVAESLELISEVSDGYKFSYQDNVSFYEGGEKKVWFRLVPSSAEKPVQHFSIDIETGGLEHLFASDKDVTFLTENLMVADESRYELRPTYDIYARANDVTPVYAGPTHHYIALISRDEITAVDFTSDGDEWSSVLSVVDINAGVDVPIASLPRIRFRSFISSDDTDIFSVVRTPLENGLGPSSCLWFTKSGEVVQEVALEHTPLNISYYASSNQSVFITTYNEATDETFRNIVTMGGDIIDLDYKHPEIFEDNNRWVSPIEVLGTWKGGGGNIPNNFWTAFKNTQETI